MNRKDDAKKRKRRSKLIRLLGGGSRFKKYSSWRRYGASDEEIFWLAKSHVDNSLVDNPDKATDILTIIRGAFIEKYNTYTDSEEAINDIIKSKFRLEYIGGGKMGGVWKLDAKLNLPFRYGIGTSRKELVPFKKAYKVTSQSAETQKLVDLLKDVHMPNVVKPEEVVEGDKTLVVFNIVGGLDLSMYIEKEGTFTDAKSVLLGYDILQGLIQLKKVGLSHRDLHARNVLISDNYRRGSSESCLEAKIIDLGVVSDNSEIRESRTMMANNDLVSLGMLIYKMYTGRNMFNNSADYTLWSEVKNDIHENKMSSFSEHGILSETKNRLYSELSDLVAPIVVTLTDNNPFSQPDLSTLEAASHLFMMEYGDIISDINYRRHYRSTPGLQQDNFTSYTSLMAKQRRAQYEQYLERVGFNLE